MVNQLSLQEQDEAVFPDAEQLITEDDTPVDNFASEKQQRLLTSALFSSLKDHQPFIAAANVGIYHTFPGTAIVPDVFVSFGVAVPKDWWEKQNRCYLVWKFGKPPEIAIEVVSNKVGKELTDKLAIYERMRVSYYAVYDPNRQLGDAPLRLFELQGMQYREMPEPWMEQVSLGLMLWEGDFEGSPNTWLRWQDGEGNLLLTGDEQAEQERDRAAQAQADLERERERADRLAAYLRSQGIDPDQLPQ
ncbi:Uma2 family endonuclease [Leptolyngbya iicbica LK]|uniref:Uma2 family endonuclease n=2 Tax=Cyanophyceae TaxID=3028117 RepID=A0A4Q7E458_9CYAN|nr:Uma2 family endonuclease [Leptolyngbya sp. LK]RZM76701.1 Uma2 family endonuclease [Leptolyngbya sp. LK]